MESRVEIALIGGTGLQDSRVIKLKDVEEVKVYTPFGATSDNILVGKLEGRRVAFLPRHGRNHTIPAHRVNYKANVWALRELGAKRILALMAVGSLREEIKPGDIVIPDQFVDNTKRVASFYEGGRICYVSMAEPFCEELSKVARSCCEELKIKYHYPATYVCIEGPRFSTRAESKLFRMWGVDVVGMTLVPECVLARELGICYLSLCMVTDYDVWAEKPVDAMEVVRTYRRNFGKLKRLVREVLLRIPKERKCRCELALKDACI